VDLKYLQLRQALELLQTAHRGDLVVVECQEVYLRAVGQLGQVIAGQPK
jgi:hypothetical protein